VAGNQPPWKTRPNSYPDAGAIIHEILCHDNKDDATRRALFGSIRSAGGRLKPPLRLKLKARDDLHGLSCGGGWQAH